MAAVAKLLCDLAKGGGGAAEVRWRWMRAVRLMGVVAEGRGRWEKRAADLNGDNLNSDMTRLTILYCDSI